MKKKILCFIFAFIFMFPFTFMLSGCFGENPPSDPPTEQGPDSGNNNGNNNENNGGNNNGNNEPQALTVDTILTAVESVKRENYSLVLGAEYTTKEYQITNGIQGAGQTKGVSMPTITGKVDGDNAYLNSNSLKGYIINGQSYGVDSNGYIDVNYTNHKNGIVDEDTQILNIINQFSNGEIFGAFVKTAKIINKNGITVTEATDKTTVTLDIDFKDVLQKTQTNLKTNNKKTLATFINQLLADISGETVDIVAIVNEFKATYTDDSTIEDLINFVSKKTDIPFLTILEKVDAITKLYEDIQNEYSSNWQHYDGYKLDYGNIYGSIFYSNTEFAPELDRDGYSLDSIKTMKLSGFANTENTNKTTKDFIFDTIEECLTDEDLTIDVLMQNYYGNEYEVKVEQLNEITSLDIKQATLFAQFVFDKNYNFVSIDLSATAEGSSVDATTKEGFGGKIVSSLSIQFSNYGTTSVTIPGTSTVDHVSLDIYLTTDDIAKLVNSNYIIQLDKLALNIGSFSINGFKKLEGAEGYSTTLTTLVSYNSAVKILTINNNILLEAFSNKDINNVEFYMTNNDNSKSISYYINVLVVAE